MTAMSAAAFDPAVYKETTRLAWERAASAWDGWGGVLERWLAEATEVMLDNAGVTCGSRVLDVAAGAGGQALAAAERTGSDGFLSCSPPTSPRGRCCACARTWRRRAPATSAPPWRTRSASTPSQKRWMPRSAGSG